MIYVLCISIGFNIALMSLVIVLIDAGHSFRPRHSRPSNDDAGA